MRPWWIDAKYMIHAQGPTYFGHTKMYARKHAGQWEYALTTWRGASAYLEGLYCNGENLSPPHLPVLDARAIAKMGAR